MKYIVVFDLDGTLANNAHRDHLLPAEGRLAEHWDAHAKACGMDQPILDTIDVMGQLEDRNCVVILTGRSEVARPETEAWLIKHDVRHDGLIMRQVDDHRKATEFKEEALRAMGLKNILCCFDDDPELVAHIRAMGVTCYDVGSRS